LIVVTINQYLVTASSQQTMIIVAIVGDDEFCYKSLFKVKTI